LILFHKKIKFIQTARVEVAVTAHVEVAGLMSPILENPDFVPAEIAHTRHQEVVKTQPRMTLLVNDL
jgi:hypothetical protein